MSTHHQVLIVGGGTAGITVASQLCELEDAPQVTIVEPKSVHYYQPIWTLVGAGVFDKEISVKPLEDYIPHGAEWIQDYVDEFDPANNAVTLQSGESLTYDYLVVAAGIQLNWDAIAGLEEALGKNGVCSNYSYETVDSTWETLQNFRGGNAVFTFPSTTIKCAGAPQKIMWLTEHYLERNGLRDKSQVIYASSTAGIFGVDKYKRALQKLVDKRDIVTHFKRNLVEVRADKKQAVFEDLDGGDQLVLDYDMLHVTPPQGPPDFIKNSPLANDGGWVDVDKYTTQHVEYPNVFSLGDCSGLPTSRTGAAIRKEAPVTVANLVAQMNGKPLDAKYDGYASCPLVTGYGRLILAEFDYDGNPTESFPFDQSRERYSMYAMKAYGLPEMYWHGMLRGRA
ncbi:NAD(P)/FAD-dependent oxidoreductase [Persicimonas caeni]|uniref:NAD(P)/FAD-dependent oxidoreductase n=1 Tax=Persicimonas caeni TaxID=2292766 RepID=A0A4Y6PYU4_PERCE|nr:FAD/NAD(P)-binding oxidoreductase [Persicimonas caeni]QDG52905.1 NAD(P)/FAD-dependent oxidoreductase [Persicimonas caeni]QED34127.1 NAD(P)/FAD-dependent oxidoreductase [Persicimonas caeni]